MRTRAQALRNVKTMTFCRASQGKDAANQAWRALGNMDSWSFRAEWCGFCGKSIVFVREWCNVEFFLPPSLRQTTALRRADGRSPRRGCKSGRRPSPVLPSDFQGKNPYRSAGLATPQRPGTLSDPTIRPACRSSTAGGPAGAAAVVPGSLGVLGTYQSANPSKKMGPVGRPTSGSQ